jgi:hypothetical protein
MTRKELRIVVRCMKNYPAGHGSSFFSHSYEDRYRDAASVCQMAPDVMRYG